MASHVQITLQNSILNSRIVEKPNGYKYFVWPLADGVPPIHPDMVGNAADLVTNNLMYNCDNLLIDMILAPEAMGIPIAQEVSRRLRKPYSVVRKRKYGLPGEIEVTQQTGYSVSNMYINCVEPRQQVVIIDDVVSTGGTLKAIMSALTENGIGMLGAFTIIEKNGAAKKLFEEGYNVHALFDVVTDNNGIKDVLINE